MKTLHNFYLLAVMAFLLGAACSNNDPDEQPEPPEEPQEPVNFMDTASLETVLLNLREYIPTWEELEGFTSEAQRLPIPTFEKRALSWYGVENDGGPFDTSQEWMPQVLAYNKNLIDQFGANMSTALMSPLPPFTLEDGGEITFPMEGDLLDKKLRSATVLFLYEKSLGLPSTFVNFYPPHQESEVFETRAEFYQWLDTKFLPEKEAEAKAAELMKAEKYMPWPLEFELFITDIGGIYDDGFLAQSSPEEVLEFANDVKARIFNTVRPHFQGNLVAHLFHNYTNRPEHNYWDQMSYEGFDEIHFAYFPQFDLETTARDLDTQLSHYAKIVQNSGNIPWLASEISVFEWYIEDGKMEEYEKDLYELVFTKLETAPIPPKGISPAGGYMKTQAAIDYVKNYFASH